MSELGTETLSPAEAGEIASLESEMADTRGRGASDWHDHYHNNEQKQAWPVCKTGGLT